MSIDFSDFIDALGGNEFDERPVDIEQFVEGDAYLGLAPLSDIQYTMVRQGTQIYKKETLVELYGQEEGEKRFKQTNNEVILALGKGCHAPYTPVFNAKTGNWQPLNTMAGDQKVAALQENKSSIEYATESFCEGHGKMVRVTTSLGFTEDVFIGHKYYAFKKLKFYKRFERSYLPEFTAVSDLVPGDRVAIGLNYSVDSPEDIPVDHAKLIGYWLGDGVLPTDSNQTINMDFCASETESMKEYVSLCSSGKLIKHKTKNLVYIRHGKNSAEVELAKKYNLWGMRSKTKRIPDAVWKSSNVILAETIAKLWQTDGCVYNKNGGTAEFVSVSQQLAVDVQRALLRLGVPSSIRSRIPKSNFKNVSVAWYVTVSSQEAFNRFTEVIKLLDHKRHPAINKSGRVYKRIDGDIYWDRVVSIEELPEGEYWTMTVPGSGNYVGNGLVSANSGKDFTATVMCAYVVYLLLCLKEPARYYGKPVGDAIDIINVAVNAAQAKNVFFKGFTSRIKNSPWFAGKYKPKADLVEFDKSITVHSGHSEREAWEGFNLIFCVLDEISAFNIENSTGHQSAKTAGDIYRMFRGSVDSRFPDYGKVVLLSFPRFKGDFISQHYESVIADKEVMDKSHTFKIHDDMPDGLVDNEFTIHWEEDKIIYYNRPKVFALRRPTWEVNPTRDIEDFKNAFLADPIDALGRFAAMPPDMVDAYFPSKERLEAAFNRERSNIEGGFLSADFEADETKDYYMHVDLAQKHDRCSVAVAHVESFQKVGSVMGEDYVAPRVVVDFIRYWEPNASKNLTVDFTEVKEFIVAVKRRIPTLKLVTFDRWNSFDMMRQLEQHDIATDTLSVAKKHYDDFKLAIAEGRVYGPKDDKLLKELVQLRIVRDKVDHPRSGFKDISDSVCGAIFNAGRRTPRNRDIEVDVLTIDNFARKSNTIDESSIKPPPREMPDELKEIIFRMI